MSGKEHARVPGRFDSAPFFVLLVIVLIAGIVLSQRFILGLGEVTNLNDGYPWGIWIAIDLIIGTALGCGGFVMALLVYVLNKGEYHPLARAGLMTSLFGYTLGAVAVLIDLGRYWQGQNILFPWLWNPNSVLLETALCIFIYIVVLAVEFAPAVFERLGLKDARKRLHRVLFVFTAFGVLLPMMHQSSMGTVVIILGHQLSPLWHSQFLTLFFLLTAFTMGFSVIAFESVVSSMAFKRPYETRILPKLSGIMAWTLLVMLVLRVLDVIRLDALNVAFWGDLPAYSFWIEMALGVAAVALLLPPFNRTSMRFVFLGSIAMLTHGFLYRLNCYLIGYDPGTQWSYFPSVGEILVTIGIFALHVLLYLVFVKQLPVLHAVRDERPSEAAG